MAHKHLHELLKEDQEPFHLHTYIADKRFHPSKSAYSLQLKKTKPATSSSSSSSSSSKRGASFCFLSSHESPDVRRSPFLPSPPARKTQNDAVLLHVPEGTAALLLEAAMRVHHHQNKQHSSSSSSSSKGFNLFGSILKRLKDRTTRSNNTNKKHETISAYQVKEKSSSAYEISASSCSCNNSRLSSAGWSESNEDKSLMDLESSISSCCRSDEEFDDINDNKNNIIKKKNDDGDAFLSSHSPLSPFRFSLRRSPSTGFRTPDFSPPPASPIHHHHKQGKENYGEEEDGLKNNHIEVDDEETEQNSPVSVLENPFELEDNDGDQFREDEDVEENEYSYAMVQRTKLQLLDKLRRFEKLAELDPVELEKRMVEQADEDDKSEEDEDDELVSSHEDGVLSGKVSADMRRLVFDLIAEEQREANDFIDDQEVVTRRVLNKLNLWEQVQSNTIDMTVNLDFGQEYDGWKKYEEQMREISTEIEIEIVNFLVDELSEELSC